MKVQKCILHQNPYQYFCEKCIQPVCRDCTYLGPHNTQTHRIAQLSTAYEKRVYQTRQRIANLMDGFRSKVLLLIDQQNNKIDNISNQAKVIDAQNNKFRIKIVNRLIQNYQHNSHQISELSEELNQQLNTINDIGHQYQQLKRDVEKVVGHQKAITDFKEEIDKIEILLAKKLEIKPLPKQNTDLRVLLNKICSLQALQQQKIAILREILDKCDKQVKSYKSPEIPYEKLLMQLQQNMKENQQFYVCHFCGQAFSYQLVNTQCKKNKAVFHLQMTKFQGFCVPAAQSARFGTHRHFFSKPKSIISHYKKPQGNFKIHLNAMSLKLQTLASAKKVNLKKQLSKGQIKQGQCQKIVIQYCLMQLCKLSQKQTEILMKNCQIDDGAQIYQYTKLLKILDQTKVDFSRNKQVSQP